MGSTVHKPNNGTCNGPEYVLSLSNGVKLVIPDKMIRLRNQCLQELLALSEDILPAQILKCDECPWNKVKLGANLLCTFPELDALCTMQKGDKRELKFDYSIKEQRAIEKFKRSAYSKIESSKKD